MTNLEFFKQSLDRGVEILRIKIQESGVSDLITIARADEMPLGFFGSTMIQAMGCALMSMKMTQWESFYLGYVEWAKACLNVYIADGKKKTLAVRC